VRLLPGREMAALFGASLKYVRFGYFTLVRWRLTQAFLDRLIERQPLEASFDRLDTADNHSADVGPTAGAPNIAVAGPNEARSDVPRPVGADLHQ
jgi:hypothetical protein